MAQDEHLRRERATWVTPARASASAALSAFVGQHRRRPGSVTRESSGQGCGPISAPSSESATTSHPPVYGGRRSGQPTRRPGQFASTTPPGIGGESALNWRPGSRASHRPGMGASGGCGAREFVGQHRMRFPADAGSAADCSCGMVLRLVWKADRVITVGATGVPNTVVMVTDSRRVRLTGMRPGIGMSAGISMKGGVVLVRLRWMGLTQPRRLAAHWPTSTRHPHSGAVALPGDGEKNGMVGIPAFRIGQLPPRQFGEDRIHQLRYARRPPC